MTGHLYEALHNFEIYSTARNFAPSLKKILTQVIKDSLTNGDGMIWTDNFLGQLLKNPDSKLFYYLSDFPGIRGTILVDKDLRKGDFYAQDLIFEPSLHKNIDFLVREYNYRHPGKIIDENKLVEIEIQNAMEIYGHTFEEIEFFVDTRVYSIELLDETISDLKDLIKFRYALTNVLILSKLCSVHPFDVFERNNSYIPAKSENFERKFQIFLTRIRDSQRISISVISNAVIKKITSKISRLDFEMMFGDGSVGEDDVLKSKIVDEYKFNGYNLTGMVENYGGSIFALDQRMAYNNDSDYLWPFNEKLLIYLRDNRLNVATTDNYGYNIKKIDSNSVITNLDIIKSNPIWNDTIIENFEYLINKSDVREEELQLFFESYPQFLLNDLYISAYPQITLIDNASNRLRPDFLLRKIDSEFVDIVEIKRPISKVMHKTYRGYPVYFDELQKAIVQLKCYRDWFQQNDNRKKIKEKYGVDGYEPTTTLIIGRKSSFQNEIIKRKLFLNDRINLLTYDDLLSLAKKRKNGLF